MNINLFTIQAIINTVPSKNEDAAKNQCIAEAAKILKNVVQEDNIQELMAAGGKSIVLKDITAKERAVIKQAEKALFPSKQPPKTLSDILPESRNLDHPLYKWTQTPLDQSIEELDFWLDMTNSDLNFLEITQTMREEFSEIDFVSKLRPCYFISLSQENKLNPLFNILTTLEPNLILEKESNGKNVFENALLDDNKELVHYLSAILYAQEPLKLEMFKTPLINMFERPEILYLLLLNYPKHLLMEHLENTNYATIGMVVTHYNLWFPPFNDTEMIQLAAASCKAYLELLKDCASQCDFSKDDYYFPFSKRFETFYFKVFELSDENLKILKDKLAQDEKIFTLADGKPILHLFASPEVHTTFSQVLKLYPEELLLKHLEIESQTNPFIAAKALEIIPLPDKNLEKLATTVCETYKTMLKDFPTLAYLTDTLHRYLSIDLTVFHLTKEKEEALRNKINSCKKNYGDLFHTSKGHFQNKLSEIGFGQTTGIMEGNLGVLSDKHASLDLPACLFYIEFLKCRLSAVGFRRQAPPHIGGTIKEIALKSKDLKDSIKKVLGDQTKPFEISPILTPNHMMLLIKQNDTYRFFDPNLGIIASKNIENLSEYVTHFINKFYFNIGNLIPPSEDIRFEQFTNQFVDLLRYPEGVCFAWCLDFAEQLTNKHLAGIPLDSIRLEDFSYEPLGWKEYHLKEGKELFERGQFQKASELFQKILIIEPSNVTAKNEILLCEGKLLYQKSDFKSAYDKFIESENPSNIDIQLCKGFIALSNYDYEKAWVDFLAYPKDKTAIQGLKICALLDSSQNSEIKEKEIEDILNFFLNFAFEEKPNYLFFRVLAEGQKRFPNNNYFALAKALFADDKIAEFKTTGPIHRKLKQKMELATKKIENSLSDAEQSPHTTSGSYFVGFYDISFSKLQ